MTQNPEKTPSATAAITIGDKEYRFASPTVWDSVLFRKHFGRNIEALGMEAAAVDALPESEREAHQAFQQEGMLWLVWRCAVAGGSDLSEEDFWSGIAITDMGRVIEVAAGFFGGTPA